MNSQNVPLLYHCALQEVTGNDIKTPSTELKTPSVTTPFLKARNECYVIKFCVQLSALGTQNGGNQ